MKSAVEWLLNLFGPKRAEFVARAYQENLDPDTAHGKAILTDLAWYCGANQSAHTPGDPYETANNCGRQDVYFHIMEMLNLKPGDFKAAPGNINAQG